MNNEEKRLIIKEFLQGFGSKISNDNTLFWFTVDDYRISISLPLHYERILFHYYSNKIKREDCDNNSLHIANYISSIQGGPIFMIEPQQATPVLHNSYGIYSKEQLDSDFDEFISHCVDFESFAAKTTTIKRSFSR